MRGASRMALLAVAAIALAGCGVASSRGGQHQGSGLALHGHPQAVEPVAGASAPNGGAATSGPSDVSVGTSGGSLAQPLSDAQVRQQLADSGVSANPNQATLTAGGLAIAPVDAPPAVQEMINAANQIARLPYIWGGGHITYEDTGYDCSGSLSFILASAGLLKGTETSGGLMSYGDAGLGKWVTIFANQGHTFAYIAGLRFDTVALAETGSRWSNRAANEPDLSTFVARHPPGL